MIRSPDCLEAAMCWKSLINRLTSLVLQKNRAMAPYKLPHDGLHKDPSRRVHFKKKGLHLCESDGGARLSCGAEANRRTPQYAPSFFSVFLFLASVRRFDPCRTLPCKSIIKIV